MNLLIDSHVFIWWAEGLSQLSPTARGYLSDSKNKVYLSIASLWELYIKINNGKLTAKTDLRRVVEDCAFPILPITPDDVEVATGLPMHHRDPFDRMLIAQAVNNNMVLVTADEQIIHYEVSLLKS